MIQEFPRKKKDDTIKMRMDLTFDVPPEFAELIEMWGIYQFERCEYDEQRQQMCLSASAELYRKGA